MAELYDITLPVLLRYLDNLDGLLAKAGTHLRDSGADETALLDRALQEGMFPLKWQLKIAIGFALRTVNPLLPEPLAPKGRSTASRIFASSHVAPALRWLPSRRRRWPMPRACP
jgi:Domain of unknown function (DUF1993)